VHAPGELAFRAGRLGGAGGTDHQGEDESQNTAARRVRLLAPCHRLLREDVQERVGMPWIGIVVIAFPLRSRTGEEELSPALLPDRSRPCATDRFHSSCRKLEAERPVPTFQICQSLLHWPVAAQE
jgi:hypothetical protein